MNQQINPTNKPSVDDELETLVDRIYSMAISGVTKDKADALIQADREKRELEARESELRLIPWKKSDKYGINSPYITKTYYLERIAEIQQELKKYE